jgi:outer membrane receptor protein involved in Fe transport
MFWNDSTVTRTEPLTPETHHLLEVRVELTPGQSSRLGMWAFRRSVSAPVVFFPGSQRGGFPGFHVTNGAQLVTQGLELSVAARFWLLELEGMAAWQERPRGDAAMREVLPRLTGHAGLYLSGTFLDGQLPIRAGGRFRWQTSFRGERLNPAVLAFVPNEGPAIGEWAVLDAEARARIGDAVLFFLWENLTDIRAYAAPYYPVGERAIWFGLSWEFLN